VQLAWCLLLSIPQFCFVTELYTTVRTACQCRPQLASGSRHDCFELHSIAASVMLSRSVHCSFCNAAISDVLASVTFEPT